MYLTAEQFDFLRRLLEEQVGMALEADQQLFAASRLQPVARRYGWASLDPLMTKLRNPAERLLIQEAIEALLTHETSFFRDPHYFDDLADRILPGLIARRADARRLKLWCAACSTGQEPYSLAMLLKERFADRLREWQIELLATDVSVQAITQAQNGHYSEVELRRGLSDVRVHSHGRRTQQGWQIADSLRHSVRFQRLNLLNGSPEGGPFDLVLLRNVLIYMSPESRRTVVARIQRSLANDGHLLLGSTESASGFGGNG